MSKYSGKCDLYDSLIMIKDIKDWIQKNQTGYAADANYTTGAKSEFVKQI